MLHLSTLSGRLVLCSELITPMCCGHTRLWTSPTTEWSHINCSIHCPRESQRSVVMEQALVMELIKSDQECADLMEVVCISGALRDMSELAKVVHQTARAVEYLHKHTVPHIHPPPMRASLEHNSTCCRECSGEGGGEGGAWRSWWWCGRSWTCITSTSSQRTFSSVTKVRSHLK